MKLYPEIQAFIEQIDPETVPDDRKAPLQALADYLKDKVSRGDEIRLNFICTHNSRRSHLAQVWAQTMAAYFGLGQVHCYSGGTSATALYPKVAETLQKQGFRIQSLSEGDNPVYSIKFGENEAPVIGFSKTFDDEFNPKSGFAAVMTCSQADADCPFVPGTEKRIAITYDDPKEFDGTAQQGEKYLERSVQIATELMYVFRLLDVRR